MSARQTPPFRADHVGSLLRPKSLLDAREQRRRNAITVAQLEAVEDAAIREVVALQEDIGLKAVTDGEFRRTLWHVDFLTSFANVKSVPGKVTAKFHTHEGEIERTPSALAVVGKLARPKPIFVDHFRFVKSVTKVKPKLTIPSPSILHFRGGRDAIDRATYPDMARFYADLARVYSEEVRDLAAAGCRYLQIDEVNFAYLCDPKLRDQVRALGEDPDTLPHIYARLINGAIATRPKDMVVCMHLCRGNFEGAWIAEGGYEPVAETLFNEIAVDGYFLEYDTERAGGFAPLRFLPKGKTAVLGLVTTKLPQLERKNDLKRRIDAAAKVVPLERLALSPQCGFASGERGNKLTVADEIAKLRLVVETAREVWGGV
ncbi:MAG: 5-methyltetrahydropteroyltriglutamate--homocysteine S-methyltransferase [Alphaproteobacteria bacterium]|nr:5-methyltetrahydropteroyltriglutamate--homocysteine S-methyltransferase [Alphaproteobacteria bacterium]